MVREIWRFFRADVREEADYGLDVLAASPSSDWASVRLHVDFATRRRAEKIGRLAAKFPPGKQLVLRCLRDMRINIGSAYRDY